MAGVLISRPNRNARCEAAPALDQGVLITRHTECRYRKQD